MAEPRTPLREIQRGRTERRTSTNRVELPDVSRQMVPSDARLSRVILPVAQLAPSAPATV